MPFLVSDSFSSSLCSGPHILPLSSINALSHNLIPTHPHPLSLRAGHTVVPRARASARRPRLRAGDRRLVVRLPAGRTADRTPALPRRVRARAAEQDISPVRVAHERGIFVFSVRILVLVWFLVIVNSTFEFGTEIATPITGLKAHISNIMYSLFVPYPTTARLASSRFSRRRARRTGRISPRCRRPRRWACARCTRDACANTLRICAIATARFVFWGVSGCVGGWWV